VGRVSEVSGILVMLAEDLKKQVKFFEARV
jgi:hypothetical protein